MEGFQDLFQLAVDANDPVSIGIGIIVAIVLLIALFRAVVWAIIGAILGAIIGPMFLGITADEGAKGGAAFFGFLGFISIFYDKK